MSYAFHPVREKKNLRDVVTLGVSVGNLYPLGFVVVTLGNNLFDFVSYYPLDILLKRFMNSPQRSHSSEISAQECQRLNKPSNIRTVLLVHFHEQ